MKIADKLKIHALEAENFRRIRAVRIEPALAGVTEITGKNANGKTSTLDVIWASLGGAKASPAAPIRTGEKEARAFLDLGDLKVTRRWWYKGGGTEGEIVSDLRVENADGARYDKPAAILAQLVGRMSFDPLDFTRWKPEEQYAALRGFVPDFDFEANAGFRKAAYDERTDINRDVARLRAEASSYPEGAFPRIDTAALEAQMAEAADRNAKGAAQRSAIQALEARIAEGRQRIEAAKAELKRMNDHLETLIAERGGMITPPEAVDLADFQARLATARESNADADKAARRKELLAQADKQQAESEALTAKIEGYDKAAADAVAGAKMPVPGIGFGDNCVMLDGLPFSEASKAQKIRASIAIAAALSPRLRVLRVEEGAFLDAEAWDAVQAFALENDFQVMIETVGSGHPGAVVIEDGGVKGAEPDAEEEEVV